MYDPKRPTPHEVIRAALHQRRFDLIALRDLLIRESLPWNAYSDEIDDTTVALAYIYRIEQAKVIVADWSQAQDWVNWWAVNPDGSVMWYEEEPLCYTTITYCGWGAKVEYGVEIGMKIGGGDIDLPLGVDWRLLKEKRPDIQNG